MAATGCVSTSDLAERAAELGVTGSYDEMLRAVARDHQGKQQRRPESPAEEEFVCPPRVIGGL